jgi:hypothetical protein
LIVKRIVTQRFVFRIEVFIAFYIKAIVEELILLELERSEILLQARIHLSNKRIVTQSVVYRIKVIKAFYIKAIVEELILLEIESISEILLKARIHLSVKRIVTQLFV